MAFVCFSGVRENTLPPTEGSVIDDVIIFSSIKNGSVHSWLFVSCLDNPILFSAQTAVLYSTYALGGPSLRAAWHPVCVTTLCWRASLWRPADPCSISYPHSQRRSPSGLFLPRVPALKRFSGGCLLLPYHTCSPKQPAAASLCFMCAAGWWLQP